MSAIETPAWVKYAGDLFFLLLFLVVFFFLKPTSPAADEWDDNSENGPEEAPNPLEKMLVSEDSENPTFSESEETEITDPKELSQNDH